MCSDRDTDILIMIESVKNAIGLARKHSFEHTIHLLQVAILDLKMTLHAISDDELRQFVDSLDDAAPWRGSNGLHHE